jgi:hypothetical protein
MNMKKIGCHVVVSLCVLAGAAGAQIRPEAETLFRDGKELMKQGRIAEACAAFEASEATEHSIATVMSLADCRDRNHQYATAWALFLQADSQTRTDPSKAALNVTSKARAAALEPRLSYLTVSVSDESRIEGLTLTRNGKLFEPMLWNRALPVDGGDYVIAGHAPGHEAWQTTVYVPRENAKVSVEVPKFKEIGKLISPLPSPVQRTPLAKQAPPMTAQPPVPSTEQADIETQDEEAAPAPKVFTMRRKVALGVAGGGVISAVAGVVLGLSANAKQDDAHKLCPSMATPCAQADRANALLSTGRSRAVEANVAFGIGAAAAIGAGLLWSTGGSEAEHARRVSVIPHVAQGESGIAILGRF